MAVQIIQQPNGKFCLFNSIVDNITFYDATEEEIITEFAKESQIEIEKKVKEIIGQLKAGAKPYFQFTKSYTEAIETIEEIHGKDEAQK